jgi:RNA polymerase sigma-70 factor, ECF subfamily
MSNLEPFWRDIINDLGPSLYRYFSTSFANQVAADLVQETLIRLVHKHSAGVFKEDRGSIKAYAFGIARYVRLEALKENPGFDLVDDEKVLNSHPKESTVDHSDPLAHLRWAISRLKPIEQELVLLMIDDEMSLEQMAMALSIPVGTVKSHIHRAKENLRQIMEVQP